MFVSIGVPTVAPSLVIAAWSKSLGIRRRRVAVQTTTGRPAGGPSAASV
jgi:hypothetical protein